MKRGTLLSYQILSCIAMAGITLYAHIARQNNLTHLRRELPKLEKQVKAIQVENIRLQYEVDSFESPIHLMELLRKPEFHHLRHPNLEEIVILSPEGTK